MNVLRRTDIISKLRREYAALCKILRRKLTEDPGAMLLLF